MCSNAWPMCWSLQPNNWKLNRTMKLWAHGSWPNLADGLLNLSVDPSPQVYVSECLCVFVCVFLLVQLLRDKDSSKRPLNNLSLHKDQHWKLEARRRWGAFALVLVSFRLSQASFTFLSSPVIFFTLQELITSSVYLWPFLIPCRSPG